jgi:hypothetical protein
MIGEAKAQRDFTMYPSVHVAGLLVAILMTSASGTTTRVAEAAEIHRDFELAAAERDPARRAEAVLPFLYRGDVSLYLEVHKAWANCGTAALPVLRTLIADESRADRYAFLDTLVRAGGKRSVPDLVSLLREEQVYWNNLGMNLDEECKVSQARFEFLVDLLTNLHALAYRDTDGFVRLVRDRFRDHPLLCDFGKERNGGMPVGVSPVVQAAEAILAHP